MKFQSLISFKRLTAIALFTCALSPSWLAAATSAQSVPIQLSADRHYLTRGGQPLLVVADTGWFIFGRRGESAFKDYMTKRAAQGFTSILSTTMNNTAPGRNADRRQPFGGSGGADIRVRNQDYWDSLKRCVDHANSVGLTVFMSGSWLAYDGANWYNPLKARTTDELKDYGRFLGNQFKSCGNLIWIVGGDAAPVSSYTPDTTRIVDAIATGINEIDPSKPCGFHAPDAYEHTSSTWYHNRTWLDYNQIQDRSATASVATRVKNDYLRTPTKPVIFIEPSYEERTDRNISEAAIRNSIYWGWTHGGFGAAYGHSAVFGAADLSQMTDPGAIRIGTYMSRLMKDQVWHSLVPDFNGTVITSADTMGRMYDRIGKRALSYCSGVQTLTANMRYFGGSVTARWYNTQTGTYTVVAGSPFSNSGSKIFTSPAGGYVLTLESTGGASPTITNVAPVAQAQSVSTIKDAAKTIIIAATDANADPLIYNIVAAPTKGTLTGTAPNLSYKPTAGYVGSDSFTFRASDGKLISNTAIVSITIAAVSTGDTVAPSAPGNLKAIAWSSNCVGLSWSASTDNVGIAGYDIYRGALKIDSTAATVLSYTDKGLSANSLVSYSVKARDTAAISNVSSAATISITTLPSTNAFLMGINFNGPAVTIESKAWKSYATALTSGLSFPANLTVTTTAVTPGFALNGITPDAATSTMLNTGVYASTNWSMNQTITNGDYQVCLWVMENYQTNYRNFNVQLEGVTVAAGIGNLTKGAWMKYGPYPAHVVDGKLTIQLLKVVGDPHLMGVTIYHAPTAVASLGTGVWDNTTLWGSWMTR